MSYFSKFFNPKSIPNVLREKEVVSNIMGGKTFDSVRIDDIENKLFKRNKTDTFYQHIDSNGDTALTYFISNFASRSQHTYNTYNFNFDGLSIYSLMIQNDFGETPLHVAALTNNKFFIELLVKHKVDGSIKDKRSFTALDIAIMMNHTEIIEILKKLESSKISNVEPSIYSWGEMYSSKGLLESFSVPRKILFNDEICAPIQIEYGQNFNLILTDTGLVFSSGLSSYGKIGHIKKRDILIPTQIPTLSGKRIKSISCGAHHSLALDDLGFVYSWGNGSNGRLGLGTINTVVTTGQITTSVNYVSIPTVIPTLSNEGPVMAISAGLDNSFAILNNGNVYSWGSATHDKLGYENYTLHYQATPLKIVDIPPMQQVSCSNMHTVLLDKYGIVYTFGSKDGGRLGRPSNGPRKDHKPTRVRIDEKIKTIQTGSNFTTVLGVSGNLYSWGVNNRGQLGMEPLAGLSDVIDKPTLVKPFQPNELGFGSFVVYNYSVGSQHVVVLTDDGQVFTYGDNSKNQCAKGTIIEKYKEINFTKVETPQGMSVFKVSAGGNSSMISLTSDHNRFGEELLKSLESTLFQDIKLIVNNNENEFINAHKVVLAARCKKLDTLIRSQLSNPSEPQSLKCSETKSITSKFIDNSLYLNFPVSSIQILNLFLKYIYSDHTNLNGNNIRELGELSFMLGINRLSYLCNYSKSLDKLPQSTLLEDFKILKDNEFSKFYSDITFKCISNIDESSNGSINSYRLFSYLGSTYFKSMLGGSYLESSKKEIELFETSIDSITSLLNYCYSEEIPDDINQCVDLIIVCDAHSMHRAKESTASKIRSIMDKDSLCYIYHLSIIYNVKPLTVWCLSKLASIKCNIQKLPYYDQLPNELQINIKNLNNNII